MSVYVGFKCGKVHEEHIMSEYYCGGCGWPVTDHYSYCPECGGAFRESDATERTCKRENLDGETYLFKCSECGELIIDDDNYCPTCGAKVIKHES